MALPDPITVELFYEKNGLVLHTGLKVSQGTNFFIADFDPTVSERAAIPHADKSVITSNRTLGNPTFVLLCSVNTTETLQSIQNTLTSLSTGKIKIKNHKNAMSSPYKFLDNDQFIVGQYDLTTNNCRVHICKSIRYMRDVLQWPVNIPAAKDFFRTVSGRIFLYGAVSAVGLAFSVAPAVAPIAFLGAATASFFVHYGITDHYFKILEGTGLPTDLRTDGVLRTVTVDQTTYTYYDSQAK